jgi:hypothetical protein
MSKGIEDRGSLVVLVTPTSLSKSHLKKEVALAPMLLRAIVIN